MTKAHRTRELTVEDDAPDVFGELDVVDWEGRDVRKQGGHPVRAEGPPHEHDPALIRFRLRWRDVVVCHELHEQGVYLACTLLGVCEELLPGDGGVACECALEHGALFRGVRGRPRIVSPVDQDEAGVVIRGQRDEL